MQTALRGAFGKIDVVDADTTVLAAGRIRARLNRDVHLIGSQMASKIRKEQERVLSFVSLALLGDENWWIKFRDEVETLNRETAWVTLDF